MSRKPSFVTPRDRGDVEIDIDENVPEGGAFVDLDDENPDNLIIDVVDDTPENDRNRPTQVEDPLEVTEDELRGLSSRTQDRIKRLTFERETERRGREQAERELTAATSLVQRQTAENERLRTSVSTTSASLATSMIKEREAAMGVARRKLAEAHTNGDSEAIAEATAELTTLSTELTLIKAQRPREPDPNNPPPAQPQQQQPTREQPPAPLEPGVVDWLGRNRWFNTPGNEEKTAIAMATHSRLVNSGVKPGDPRYVQGLDEGLKKLFPDHRASTDPEKPTRERETQRRGDVVNGGGRQTVDNANPRRVSLTASELSLAKKLGVSPQAYAASKVKHNASKGSAR